MHHERVGEALDDGALTLTEALLVEALSRVVQVLFVLGLLIHGKVILSKERGKDTRARGRKNKREHPRPKFSRFFWNT